MQSVFRDPLAKLRIALEQHNRIGSHETWEQYNAVIAEYARAGVGKLADLRSEVEGKGSVAVQAAQAIGRMGVVGWPTLRDLLKQPDSTVRYFAITGGAFELWREPQRDGAMLMECAEILEQILRNDIPGNQAAVVRITRQFANISYARPLVLDLAILAWEDSETGKSARCTFIAWGDQGALECLAYRPHEALRLQSDYERAKLWETRFPTVGSFVDN